MSSPQIVVVAYGAPEHLVRALAPVAGRYPVTVVDNSSSGRVRAVVGEAGARYLDPGRNLGFAAGVNLALRATPPADVLLLNPDAVLPEDGVDTLVEVLHSGAHARTGSLTPRLRAPDGSEQRTLWPFPTPARAWAEACGLGRAVRAEDFAVGAVLLLRREALAEVGPLDERFFLYAEEADWQRRARARGWHAARTAAVVADHVGGGTSSDPERRERLFHAGTETYVRKWFGAAGWCSYRGAVLAGTVPRRVLLPRARRGEIRRRARIYRQGPRRAAGLEGS